MANGPALRPQGVIGVGGVQRNSADPSRAPNLPLGLVFSRNIPHLVSRKSPRGLLPVEIERQVSPILGDGCQAAVPVFLDEVAIENPHWAVVHGPTVDLRVLALIDIERKPIAESP